MKPNISKDIKKPSNNNPIGGSEKEIVPAVDILHWLNIARTKPKQIASNISERMKNFKKDNEKQMFINGVTINCLEGKKAYIEAIDFLQKQKPMAPFILDEILCEAAKNHTLDMIGKGFFGHEGTGGSTLSSRIQKAAGGTVNAWKGQNCDQPMFHEGPNFAEATVIRYIIDEAVPSRGHRSNIYSENFNYVGIHMAKHEKAKGYKSTIDFCSLPLSKTNKTKVQTQKQKNPQQSSVPAQKKKQQIKVPSPKQLLEWINVARTKPLEIKKIIQQNMKNFMEEKVIKLNGIHVGCIEGKSAYLQAIKFLEKQKPLPPLKMNQFLLKGAQAHLKDMINNNFFQYNGSKGETITKRVEQIFGRKIIGNIDHTIDRLKAYYGPDFAQASVLKVIIDEGIQKRTNRDYIFNPDHKYFGFCSATDEKDGFLKNTFVYFTEDLNKQKIVLASNDQDLLEWVNFSRTKPKDLAKIIEKMTQSFIEEKLLKINGLHVRASEGLSAFKQAIDFLNKVSPLKPLAWNQCLAEAAADHTKDLVKNNIFGHTGSDGSSLSLRVKRRAGKVVYGGLAENCDQLMYFHGPNFAKQSVIRYIIDEGVPSRGHRTNIYNETMNYMGGSLILDTFNEGGYKSTIDFSTVDIETPKKSESNPEKPSPISSKKRLETIPTLVTPNMKNPSMTPNMKNPGLNTPNMKKITNSSDALSKLLTKQPKQKPKKVVKTSTSTATKTSNGIKKTTVITTKVYDDGSVETTKTET